MSCRNITEQLKIGETHQKAKHSSEHSTRTFKEKAPNTVKVKTVRNTQQSTQSCTIA